MLQLNDFIRYVNGKSKTTAKVISTGVIKNYLGVSTGENVHIEDCELWKPQKNEYAFNSKYGLVKVLTFDIVNDTYLALPVATELASLQHIKLNDLEPFIGTLPSFINI